MIEHQKKKEQSIVDQYNEDIDYASKVKEESYKKADDAYNIAMRDANANFRTNQPTYGAGAEQLLGSGLTGSGYSDYLVGKAYEARTGEINAARSQMSYAKQLADSQYEAAKNTAETNKISRQDALDQWKLEYAVQLDAEYKAKVEEVLQAVLSGDYDVESAKTVLQNYANGGELSEGIINSIIAHHDTYALTEYINWMSAQISAGQTPNALAAKAWLQNTKIGDAKTQEYLDLYFNADGSLKKTFKLNDIKVDVFSTYTSWMDEQIKAGKTPTVAEAKHYLETLGVDNASVQAYLNVYYDKNGNLLTKEEIDNNIKDAVNPDNKPENDNNEAGDQSEKLETPITDPSKALEYAWRKIQSHTIGNNSTYENVISELQEYENTKLLPEGTVAQINNMKNGLVISSGTLKNNGGLKQNFDAGDNFTVLISGKTYRIESAGKTDNANVIEKAKNVGNGTVFGYGSELYVKVGADTYKIQARPGLFNGQYDKLWKAVYGEAVDRLAKNESINASNGDQIQRGNARFRNDAQDATSDLSKGDNFNISAGGKVYRIESGGEVDRNDNKEIYDKATAGGVEDGEVFVYINQAYLYKNGSIYHIDTRALGPNQETKLISMITGNPIDPNAALGSYSSTMIDTASDEHAELTPGISVGILSWDGTEYNVMVAAKLDKNTAAYKAASITDENGNVLSELADGQAYFYGDDIYVKKGEYTYLIQKGKKKYDKLKEYLETNTNVTISAYGNATQSDSLDGPIGTVPLVIDGTTYNFENVKTHKENDAVYRRAKAAGVQNGQMFILNDTPFYMGENQVMEFKIPDNASFTLEDLKEALGNSSNISNDQGADVGGLGAGIGGLPNGAPSAGNNNSVNFGENSFVANSGNIIANGITLQNDGNNHKTLNVVEGENSTTYGVSKVLSEKSEKRWEGDAIFYAKNNDVAIGDVFTYSDASGDYICYRDVNDKNDNPVFYELSNDETQWNNYSSSSGNSGTGINQNNDTDSSKGSSISFKGIGEALKNAGQKIKSFFNQKAEKEAANANNADNSIDRAYNAGISGESLFDKGLDKGDWFTIDVVDNQGSNTTYRVKSGGAVDKNSAIYAAAAAALSQGVETPIYDGEVFAYGDEVYLMKNGTIYTIDTRLLSPKQEEKLRQAIKDDQYAPEINGYKNGVSHFAGDVTRAETSVDSLDKTTANDTIKVNGNNTEYKVKVATVLGTTSEAYLAAKNNQVKLGETFLYRGSAYVFGKDKVYKLKDDAKTNALINFVYSGYSSTKEPEITTIKAEERVEHDISDLDGRYINTINRLNKFDGNTNSEYANGAFNIQDSDGQTKVIIVKFVGKYGDQSNVHIAAAKNLNKSTDPEKNDDLYKLFLWNGDPYVWLGDTVVQLESNAELIEYLKKIMRMQKINKRSKLWEI